MRSDVRNTEQANGRHRAMRWPRGRGRGEILAVLGPRCRVLLTIGMQLLKSFSLLQLFLLLRFLLLLKVSVFSGVGSSLGHLAFCFHAVHSPLLPPELGGCLSILRRGSGGRLSAPPLLYWGPPTPQHLFPAWSSQADTVR